MHRHRSLAAVAGSGALDIGDEALGCSSHNVLSRRGVARITL
jgi:hypothetical protein